MNIVQTEVEACRVFRSIHYKVVSGDRWLLDKVDSDIAWYNHTRVYRLTVYFELADSSPSTLWLLSECVTRYHHRRRKARRNPEIIIQAHVSLIHDDLVQWIESIDMYLPRLALVANYFDIELSRHMRGILRTVASSLRRSTLQHLFTLFSKNPYDNVEQIEDHLLRIQNESDPLPELPSLEIPFEVEYGEALPKIVDRFLTKFPQVIRPVQWTKTGYIGHSYILKELWYIGKIIKKESLPEDLERCRAGYSVADALGSRISAYEEGFLRYIDVGRYNEWRRHGKQVIFDNDIESISDSLECQSPIFCSNSWFATGSSIIAGA